MSDLAVTKQLAVIDTIKDGIGIGMKNVGPILVNIILYVLTCWIPYLNIGTTIGLSVGIISKASKGEAIPMTEIFDPKYRKYMGEYFLTLGLMFAGIGVLAATIIFSPAAIVLSIAWSLSLLLAVDKGKNPTEAISLSNKCTYGNKLKIFCINLVICIVVCILAAIFVRIPAVGWLLVLALFVFQGFVGVGIAASIYKQLTEGV